MKKFLIIGNGNAITYKEIFPLIKENKMWLGVTLFCGKMPYFCVPKEFVSENDRVIVKEDGTILKQLNSIAWFTNLDHANRHTELDLYKKYNAEEYPKYDGYDAINVDRVVDIPKNYFGEIGVPISFLNKLNRNQFEITGILTSYDKGQAYVNGKHIYARLLIKRKKE